MKKKSPPTYLKLDPYLLQSMLNPFNTMKEVFTIPMKVNAIPLDLTTELPLLVTEMKTDKTSGLSETHGELHGEKKDTSELLKELELAVSTLMFHQQSLLKL